MSKHIPKLRSFCARQTSLNVFLAERPLSSPDNVDYDFDRQVDVLLKVVSNYYGTEMITKVFVQKIVFLLNAFDPKLFTEASFKNWDLGPYSYKIDRAFRKWKDTKMK